MPQSNDQILTSIFSAETGWPMDLEKADAAPAFADVLKFCKVLANHPQNEESLQKFLASHPRFVTGMFGYGDDSILAFITKPAINNLRADFAVLTYGQGGCFIHVIEIEPASERLYTKKGLPANRHNQAITQVRDWHSWIQPNTQAFVRSMLQIVEKLPEHPKKHRNYSYRTRPMKHIEASWRGFGGYDSPVIEYTVVIGRWAELPVADRKRLLQFNQHESRLFKVFTYDQLIRSSLERAYRQF